MIENQNTEQVLARLRDWMEDADREASEVEGEWADLEPVGDESVGLFQVVAELTAARHELKLLTKATRVGEERSESAVLGMQAAIEQFRTVEANEQKAGEDAARPLVEALIDLDQSLRRGRQALDQARRRILAEAGADLLAARERFEQLYRSQPWWRRWLCRNWHAALVDIHADRALDLEKSIFTSLLEGYDLIQSRLQRSLDEQQIVRMDCIGRQADPRQMTVIDTVSEPAQPPGLVVEEVRIGYFWRGKVFRFAEVKVVAER